MGSFGFFVHVLNSSSVNYAPAGLLTGTFSFSALLGSLGIPTWKCIAFFYSTKQCPAVLRSQRVTFICWTVFTVNVLLLCSSHLLDMSDLCGLHIEPLRIASSFHSVNYLFT